MQQSLTDKVALVTGASAGIGAACADQLSAAGARLILVARRQERLDSLADKLEQRDGRRPQSIAVDVRQRDAVEQQLGALGKIDMLINNAGLSRGLDPLDRGDADDWNEMIDTNVKGLLWVDRTIVPGMRERGCGDVVHIGSIAGRQTYPNGNVYCATKHAVRALTDGLRLDLSGSGVRVTSIDPGMVETEFSEVRFHGNRERAATVYQGMQPLTADDVANAVLFAVTRPAHVTVGDMLLLPTDQASATTIHRR